MGLAGKLGHSARMGKRAEITFAARHGSCEVVGMRWFGLVGLGVSAVSGVAAAQVPSTPAPAVAGEQHSDPHPWQARPFALDAMLGIATPVGLAGFSAEYAPVEAVSVSASAGTNLQGLQLGGMVRCRLHPERRTSLYVGLGYSQGRHYQDNGVQDGVLSLFTAPLQSMGEDRYQGRDWRVARWLNVELGGEQRQSNGIDARGFVGGALLVNPSENVVEAPWGEYQTPIDVRGFMVYVGGAFGYAI